MLQKLHRQLPERVHSVHRHGQVLAEADVNEVVGKNGPDSRPDDADPPHVHVRGFNNLGQAKTLGVFAHSSTRDTRVSDCTKSTMATLSSRSLMRKSLPTEDTSMDSSTPGGGRGSDSCSLWEAARLWRIAGGGVIWNNDGRPAAFCGVTSGDF